MSAPQYVDISSFQPLNIDWVAYRKWAASFDGVARVALRSSAGMGQVDTHLHAYRAGAIAAGVDVIIFYHYAYPQFGNPVAEADFQARVLGPIREHDVLMLDYEENVSQATSGWAVEWLARQEHNYNRLPTIYASDSYVRQRLQDGRLARYPLTLAKWEFTPSERPPCPPPWRQYTYLQYTDRATGIPGLGGAAVDANVYLGPEAPQRNKAVERQMIDTWNMFLAGIARPTVSYSTGIAASWKQHYQTLNAGSPMGPEKPSVDWQEKPIHIQYFTGGVKCEWNDATGEAAWYGVFNKRLV